MLSLRVPKRIWQHVAAHPLWWIFLLAAIARITYIVVAHADPYALIDNGEYSAMADDLLAGRGFLEHIGFIRPPLYPLFLATCFALGGIVTMQAAQVLLGAATSVLIGRLSEKLTGRSGHAWAAALVAAVYPWFFEFVGVIAAETLFAFLAVLSWILLLDVLRDFGWRRGLLAGGAFGLAALTRTNLLFVAPFVGLWWVVEKRSLLRPVPWGIGLLLALLPFTAFNLALGSGLVVGSSGGGMNFYLGNNPEHAALYLTPMTDTEWLALARSSTPAAEFIGCSGFRNASEMCAERASLADRERFFYAAGLRYIATYPGEWLRLEFAKLIHILRPWADPRSYPLGTVLVSGLSFAFVAGIGIAGMRRMRRESTWLVIAVAVGTVLSAILYNVQLRYRFTMLDPLLIAAGGAPAAQLARRLLALRARS